MRAGLALVGGMLPLALGTGPGAEEPRAVAIVVIGGQTLSLLLTLLVTLVAYSFLNKLDFRGKPKLAPATVHAKGHEARGVSAAAMAMRSHFVTNGSSRFRCVFRWA